jgi:hypothetical protein
MARTIVVEKIPGVACHSQGSCQNFVKPVCWSISVCTSRTGYGPVIGNSQNLRGRLGYYGSFPIDGFAGSRLRYRGTLSSEAPVYRDRI